MKKQYFLCHNCEKVTHLSKSVEARFEETGEDVLICKKCVREGGGTE